MERTITKGRELKRRVFNLLESGDFDASLKEIRSLPNKKVLNPLISALCNLDELLKWRAVTAMGLVVSDMAMADMEAARIVMRRFMWSLNDESGGIGWGAPESMAEIMTRHEVLAEEYVRILVSYLREEANFLEYEPLQRGLVWGIGRLGSVRRELLIASDVETYLVPYLESSDAGVRGLSAWASGILRLKSAEMILKELAHENERESFNLYWNGKLNEVDVQYLARQALDRLRELKKYSVSEK